MSPSTVTSPPSPTSQRLDSTRVLDHRSDVANYAVRSVSSVTARSARGHVRVVQGDGADGPRTRVHFRWARGAERTTGVVSAAEHLRGSAQGLLQRWAAVRQRQRTVNNLLEVAPMWLGCQMCRCFVLFSNNNNNNNRSSSRNSPFSQPHVSIQFCALVFYTCCVFKLPSPHLTCCVLLELVGFIARNPTV